MRWKKVSDVVQLIPELVIDGASHTWHNVDRMTHADLPDTLSVQHQQCQSELAVEEGRDAPEGEVRRQVGYDVRPLRDNGSVF